MVATLKSLGLKYPKIGDEQLTELQKAKKEVSTKNEGSS
jgi:hypothetical protein